MGKWDKEPHGDGPPVRTLFDRRTHSALIAEEDSINRIVVQPSKTPRKTLNSDLPIFTVQSDVNDHPRPAPPKPPRKFVPSSLPKQLPEGSFVKKWLMQQQNESLFCGQDILLQGQGSQESNHGRGAEPSCPPTSKEIQLDAQSSSSDSDSSENEMKDDDTKLEDVTEAFEIFDTTPVLPFHVDLDLDPEVEDADPEVMTLPVATASSSDTSNNTTTSDTTTSEIISDEISYENQQELLNYHQSILRIFDVGNRTNLNVAGMNMDTKQVEDFYAVKKCSHEGGYPVLKCSFSAILTDLKGFAKTPVAIGAIVRCHIARNKSGMDHSLYPTYYLYLEEDRSRQNRILLLTARKRKKSATSNYLISTDPAQVGRRSNAFIGKVRGNLLGTEFTIYDSGNSPKKFNYTSLGIDLFNYRQELGAVIYEPNVLGFKGPRRMKLLVPSMLGESERFECRPDVDEETILEMNKKRHLPQGLLELRNKLPNWNAETQSYVLNFKGRVTRPSVKNFQIIHSEKPEYLVLQFGRIDDDNFTLDIRYPLCPLQAFGIALTSFDSKLACE